MCNQISKLDIELIISLITTKSFNYEIKSKFEGKQKGTGEFFADHNRPCPFVLVNYDSKMNKRDFLKYDFIINFSENKVPNSTYKKQNFTILMNNGEISYLHRTQHENNQSNIKYYNSKEINFEIYYQESLFIEKQIENLPCDDYLVYFCGKGLDKKIEIKLYFQNAQILDMKIASNDKQIEHLSRHKHFMSKLSFCDFETIKIPSEYFVKNNKLLIQNSINKDFNKFEFKKIIPSFFDEVIAKTENMQIIFQSDFWSKIICEIENMENYEAKIKVQKIVSKINVFEKINFSLSLGKFDGIIQEKENFKFVYTDLSEANNCMPIFSDFFYILVDSLKNKKIDLNFSMEDFLNKKFKEFNLAKIADDKQIDLKLHFELFLIYYYLRFKDEIIFNYLFSIENNTLLKAS